MYQIAYSPKSALLIPATSINFDGAKVQKRDYDTSPNGGFGVIFHGIQVKQLNNSNKKIIKFFRNMKDTLDWHLFIGIETFFKNYTF